MAALPLPLHGGGSHSKSRKSDFQTKIISQGWILPISQRSRKTARRPCSKRQTCSICSNKVTHFEQLNGQIFQQHPFERIRVSEVIWNTGRRVKRQNNQNRPLQLVLWLYYSGNICIRILRALFQKLAFLLLWQKNATSQYDVFKKKKKTRGENTVAIWSIQLSYLTFALLHHFQMKQCKQLRGYFLYRGLETQSQVCDSLFPSGECCATHN